MTVLLYNILFFVGVLEDEEDRIFVLPLVRSYTLPVEGQDLEVQTPLEESLSKNGAFLITLQICALIYFSSFRRKFSIDLPSVLDKKILTVVRREDHLQVAEDSAKTLHSRGNHIQISMIVATLPINFSAAYLGISNNSGVLLTLDVLVKGALLALLIFDYAQEIR